MNLIACDRCGHSEDENEFDGMDVNIFDFGGICKGEDEFTLCQPCIEELRKWMVAKSVEKSVESGEPG